MNTDKLLINIDPVLKTKTKKHAKDNYMNLSEYIRRLIIEDLKKEEK